MATEKNNPKTKEKKEAKIDGDEAKLKKERQTDSRKPPFQAIQPPTTSREVDFMGWD